MSNLFNPKQIAFDLINIKVDQYAVIEDNYDLSKESTEEDIEISAEIQIKVSRQKKRIGVFLDFQYIQTSKTFLKLAVSCHFLIEDESWKGFYNKKTDRVTISKEFASYLAMISTGTSRGILFSKTEGTIFSKFILPTLKVESLIKSDIVFDSPTDEN